MVAFNDQPLGEAEAIEHDNEVPHHTVVDSDNSDNEQAIGRPIVRKRLY
jgi:hypothetical protein